MVEEDKRHLGHLKPDFLYLASGYWAIEPNTRNRRLRPTMRPDCRKSDVQRWKLHWAASSQGQDGWKERPRTRLSGPWLRYPYFPLDFTITPQSPSQVSTSWIWKHMTGSLTWLPSLPLILQGCPDFPLSEALWSRNTVSKSLMAFIPKR